MSINEDKDKGAMTIIAPFVTIYEKLIDGLVFRYTEYEHQAYIVIRDAATQIKLGDPKGSAHGFKQRHKNKFPNWFKTFRAMTRGGPQEINFATLEAINIFCSRAKNFTAASKYITKLTQFQKWFYATQAKEQALLEAKLKGDIKFLSSEIKFLHDNNSSFRRDISTLAQAVKQLQTQLDVRINSSQVDIIYDLVQNELAFVVAKKRGLTEPTSQIYRGCWLNFNKHFNIATYRNLPASQFENAKEYILYQIEKISKELE